MIREVLEETGVRYEVDRLAFIHENFFPGNGPTENMHCHELAFYFLMKPRGSRELHSCSLTSDGIEEKMYWIPIGELERYKAFPTFLREELGRLSQEIKHIVTHEVSE